jgi:dCMP deaminase
VNSEKWDRRFLKLAELVASWSKDPSTRVGAVIVDDLRLVRGLGYNGFPRGIEDDNRLKEKETKYPLVVHAEANAILNSNGSVRGCGLYSTQIPCHECCKLIIQAGIRWVAFPSNAKRWEEVLPFLTEAGISYWRIDLP